MSKPTTSGGKRPTVSGGKIKGLAFTKWSGTSDQKNFRQAVLKAAIKTRVAHHRPRYTSLKSDDLKTVPGSGGVVTSFVAAEPAGEFLAAAKEALKNARMNAKGRKALESESGKPKINERDEDILNTVDVKITGYRSVESEKRLWMKYFSGYYNRTSKDRLKFKDPHGSKAVSHMVRFISGKKAPPGFSKHTKGVSIDFFQKRKTSGREKWTNNSTRKGTETGRLKWWYGTWLYSWLHENAEKYGFKELKTEPWHYDYVGVMGDYHLPAEFHTRRSA